MRARGTTEGSAITSGERLLKVKPGSLVYVRYLDHVLFRNTDLTLYKPALRETVGWLQKETSQAVWILWERSVKPLPNERSPAKDSGLVLLKSDIVEVRLLPLQNFSGGLLFSSSALTFKCRVGASEREVKNSARKKPEEEKPWRSLTKTKHRGYTNID